MNNTNPDKLTVIGHLEELRKRIIISLVYLSCGTLISFIFAKDIILFLKLPAENIIKNLVFTRPTEPFIIYFKVALYTGAIISSPAIFYQIWQFIKPAISQQTKISLFNWVISVVIMFIIGTVFSYKIIISSGLNFLIKFADSIATPMITVDSYISFVLMILVLGGIVFEMPVISGLLTKLGIITPYMMRKRRKEAIFGLCVFVAIITPTVDAFNMVIFVLPMIVLYEASIFVSNLIYNHSKKYVHKSVYENQS